MAAKRRHPAQREIRNVGFRDCRKSSTSCWRSPTGRNYDVTATQVRLHRSFSLLSFMKSLLHPSYGIVVQTKSVIAPAQIQPNLDAQKWAGWHRDSGDCRRNPKSLEAYPLRVSKPLAAAIGVHAVNRVRVRQGSQWLGFGRQMLPSSLVLCALACRRT